MVASHVAALVLLTDPTGTFLGRRTDEIGLGARVGALPVLDQGHRVTLAADVPRKGVDFVADHVGQMV